MVLQHVAAAARRPSPRNATPSRARSSSGLPRAEVAEHEAPAARPAHVDLSRVALERDVVAEPLGLLVGVGVAADPGEQPGVVDDHALGLVEPQALAHPQRDQGLADHVLHRLAQAQVGAQRQRRHQLGEADPRPRDRTHERSLLRRAARHRRCEVRVAAAVRSSARSAALGSIAPVVTWRLAAWMRSMTVLSSHSTGSSGSNTASR